MFLRKFKKSMKNVKKVIIKPADNMEQYVMDTSTMIPQDLEVYDLMKAMQKMFQRKAFIKTS